jgi:Uma2 family endonuclease
MPQAAQHSGAAETKRKKVPAYLIKETIDGIPFYYKGYKQVLSKKKKLEEIMGWSGLQAIIVAFFTELLHQHIDKKRFRVLPGETGNHLGHRNNFSLDVSIFERALLTPQKINAQYIDVPAYCVIEVDITAEWDEGTSLSDLGFISLKTQKLFEFGTQKLVWVLSKSQKVIVATPNKHWEIIDWNEDIELMEGIRFNIGKYLLEEGIDTHIAPPSAK